MGMLAGAGKGGGSDTITPAEIEQLTRQQQRMNNPNVSNQFGSTSTTFGYDDQADITQQMSPDMQGLYGQMLENVQGGPSQFTPQSGGYNQQMMQRFNDRTANRSGFQAPQRQLTPPMQYSSPQPLGNQEQNPEIPPIGFSPPSQNFNQNNNQGGGGGMSVDNGYMQVPRVPNPLIKALMQYGGK